jgi:hypothetical protein
VTATIKQPARALLILGLSVLCPWLLVFGLLAWLSGCALAPDTIRLQGEHMSHASQHIDGTNGHMGAELVGIVAHWQTGGWFVSAEESYNFSPADGHICNGGICGNREVFQAQAGYEWRLRP